MLTTKGKGEGNSFCAVLSVNGREKISVIVILEYEYCVLFIKLNEYKRKGNNRDIFSDRLNQLFTPVPNS